ncbi:VPLPA-CTERM sorting domain-containing protein [Tateyamaria sp.]|uniref:VPLPA-CTERM sorting domain-containing protein n=1 Tax=Tateyamaria sp. TaxID=1929288 RepID=UPI00329AAC63
MRFRVTQNRIFLGANEDVVYAQPDGWRRTPLKFSAFFAAFVTALFISKVAQAAVIVADGTDKWEITTITGTFSSISADTTLTDYTSLPWYGTRGMAAPFAIAVGDRLGIPNGSSVGPYFVFTAFGSTANVFFCPDLDLSSDCPTPDYKPISAGDTHTFAWATKVSPVPLPAGLTLVLTGLAGFAGLRMRKQRKAQV